MAKHPDKMVPSSRSRRRAPPHCHSIPKKVCGTRGRRRRGWPRGYQVKGSMACTSHSLSSSILPPALPKRVYGDLASMPSLTHALGRSTLSARFLSATSPACGVTSTLSNFLFGSDLSASGYTPASSAATSKRLTLRNSQSMRVSASSSTVNSRTAQGPSTMQYWCENPRPLRRFHLANCVVCL